MDTFGKVVTTFLSQGYQIINNITSNLLFGNADSAGQYIWDWFKNATFASLELQPANGPDANYTQQQATDFMGTMVTAAATNGLWRSNYVYIVATTAQGNDCANDDRVPSDIKYCRTDTTDNNVYGIYT
jgi:hypothetical protein